MEENRKYKGLVQKYKEDLISLQSEINCLLDFLGEDVSPDMCKDSDLDDLEWSDDEDSSKPDMWPPKPSELPRTKLDDTDKAPKAKPFALDKQGQVILPIVLGRAIVRVSIYQLGHIPKDPSRYHNFDYIYPVGFCSKRKFYDISDGSRKCYYTTRIVAGAKNEPVFQIIHQSDTVVVEDSSISDLFDRFMSRFDDTARTDPGWPVFASGEEFLGLDHPTVKKYIEDLPGAAKCIGYHKYVKVF